MFVNITKLYKYEIIIDISIYQVISVPILYFS